MQGGDRLVDGSIICERTVLFEFAIFTFHRAARVAYRERGDDTPFG